MTLEDIARLAGVSRSTVSRVINNHPSVSGPVRQRVWEVVRQEDFHPNLPARALARSHSQTIGFFIPQAIAAVFADPYFPLLLQGVAAACDRHRYSLTLSFVTSHYLDGSRQMTRGRHLDGAIVASAFQDSSFLRHLAQDNFPFVLIGHQPDMPAIHRVDVDNVHGATLAVQHLARLGHRRIATVSGPLTLISARERRDGFLKGMAAYGLAVPASYLVEGDNSEQSGYDAMLYLLDFPGPQRPDALFVASDAMAVGALRAIHARGLHVPDDVALVGFDDSPVATRVEPALTTIRQPIGQLGFTAATLLIDLLAGDHEGIRPRQIVLPLELIVRESCGARRAALAPATLGGTPRRE